MIYLGNRKVVINCQIDTKGDAMEIQVEHIGDVAVILDKLVSGVVFGVRPDPEDFRIAKHIWNGLDDYEKDMVHDSLSQEKIEMLEDENEM